MISGQCRKGRRRKNSCKLEEKEGTVANCTAPFPKVYFAAPLIHYRKSF